MKWNVSWLLCHFLILRCILGPPSPPAIATFVVYFWESVWKKNGGKQNVFAGLCSRSVSVSSSFHRDTWKTLVSIEVLLAVQMQTEKKKSLSGELPTGQFSSRQERIMAVRDIGGYLWPSGSCKFIAPGLLIIRTVLWQSKVYYQRWIIPSISITGQSLHRHRARCSDFCRISFCYSYLRLKNIIVLVARSEVHVRRYVNESLINQQDERAEGVVCETLFNSKPRRTLLGLSSAGKSTHRLNLSPGQMHRRLSLPLMESI